MSKERSKLIAWPVGTEVRMADKKSQGWHVSNGTLISQKYADWLNRIWAFAIRMVYPVVNTIQ